MHRTTLSAALLFAAALLLTTPERAMAADDIEEPAYTVVAERDFYEVRDYAPFIIAEVEVEGDYRGAMNRGFRVLADYIFGNNSERMEMAMTAPVFQNEAAAPPTADAGEATPEYDQRHIVSFVMPSKFDMDSLPDPRTDRVTLREVPGGQFAVHRFSGWAREGHVEKMRRQLLEAVEADGLAIEGPVLLGQYNPPWTLPFLRRNEVLVRLAEPVATDDASPSTPAS